MSNEQSRPLADVVFAAVIVLFAGIVYWGTLDLPEPRYEPMGSAALPRALALIMAALALIVGTRGAVRLAREGNGRRIELPFRRRPWLALRVFGVLVVYLIVHEYRLISFVPSSVIAFGFIAAMLVDFDRKRLPAVLAFTTFLVILSYFVFTKLFYIDLP